ncbi:MAG: DsrE family protein [Candidatus Nitrosocaldus sp.]|nr:DsrE family protein [Candidatus Nitrosocaldus sp.]MCS7142042.1 DsrE family protein [Candidatus Nitrosocaldus sp.]MDW8000940.1 DsrE family protein [Candidatus Nitrosocaldus sp.]MDW8275843.1 DsrE family protein [Candidatus Nitrosocaldus sp.]
MKYTVYVLGIAVAAVLAIAATVQISQQQQHDSGHGAGTIPTHPISLGGPTIVIHISSGDPNDERHMLNAEMGVRMALAMQQHGKDVIVFLDSYGTLLAPKNPRSDELKALNADLQQFAMQGGRVIVCPHCYQVLGNRAEDLTPGFEWAGPGKMSKVWGGNVVVIDY